MTEAILVVDDDQDIARFAEVKLRSAGYEVAVAADGEEGLRRAAEAPPDLVLLDVMMPMVDGFEVARRLRKNPNTADTVIIMVTVRADTTDKVLGFEAGVDDYITKPFDPIELVARVQRALRRARDMRGLSPLTGLPGNIVIQERIEGLICGGNPFALLYCDLDHFKAYNDKNGFAQGDRLIQATARIVEEVVLARAGGEGFVGHVGGDDFVALVPPESAEEVARHIVAGFNERSREFYDPDELELGYVEIEDRRGDRHQIPLVSVSIGITTTAHRTFGHSAEVVAVAAEMKNFAKRQPGSSYGIDRRSAR